MIEDEGMPKENEIWNIEFKDLKFEKEIGKYIFSEYKKKLIFFLIINNSML